MQGDTDGVILTLNVARLGASESGLLAYMTSLLSKIRRKRRSSAYKILWSEVHLYCIANFMSPTMGFFETFPLAILLLRSLKQRSFFSFS